MSRLWFDPSADVASHDPPLKPVDPSRPIKRKVSVTEPEQQAYYGWPYFAASSYQAPEADPA